MTKRARLEPHEGEDIFLQSHSDSVRHGVANIWAMRAGLELAVSAGYAVIVRELLETGADKAVLQLCCEATTDEIGHAQLCLDLAERIDGQKRAWPAPASLHVPNYRGVAPGPLRTALHLVAMSCLNETIACVRLTEAIDLTECPSAQQALRSILSDEIKHARSGWAHLASSYVTPDTKRQLATFVPELVAASMTSLIEENATIPTEEYSIWGLPSVDAARAHAQKAVDDIVMPGFERLGLPVSA